MPRNTQSNGGNRGRSKNNNPEGYNQFNSGWRETARERPVAAAAAAAAAVGASVFLWSRRSQISEQISNLSDQIGEWSENMNSRGGSEEFEMTGGESSFEGSSATGSSGSQFSGGNSAGSFAGSTNPSPGNKRGGAGSGSGGKSGRTPS